LADSVDDLGYQDMNIQFPISEAVRWLFLFFLAGGWVVFWEFYGSEKVSIWWQLWVATSVAFFVGVLSLVSLPNSPTRIGDLFSDERWIRQVVFLVLLSWVGLYRGRSLLRRSLTIVLKDPNYFQRFFGEKGSAPDSTDKLSTHESEHPD
jgi:hypothetical protein